MITIKKVLEEYGRLNIKKATSKIKNFPPEQYLCLYGNTIYDSENNYGIQIIGERNVGKTTLSDQLVFLNPRFILASDDRTIFDYQNELIIPDEDLEPFRLQRMIHLIKGDNTEILYSGLEQSYEFIKNELQIIPEILLRIENNFEATTQKLYQKLTH